MAFLLRTRRRLLAFGGGLALVGVAAAGCGGDGNAPVTATTTVGSTVTAAASVQAGTTGRYESVAAALEKVSYPQDLADGTALGKKDARVVIQAFEDFTCSHCLEFSAEMEPAIVEQLVKPGTVRFEFHYLPLRQSSVGIMVAAQCAADQGRFWEYHRALFIAQAKADAKPQDQYAQAMNDGFGEVALKQYAADLKLDTAKFGDCLASPQPAIDKIQADLTQASKLGIKGTPGFVVNGRFLGDSYPANIAAWKKLVEGAAK